MRRLVLSLAAALALGSGVALAQYPDPSTPAPGDEDRGPDARAFARLDDPHQELRVRAGHGDDSSGSTVRFVEDDDTPHTVTATDQSFDSGNLNQKDSWRHTFTTEGTYTYFCAYHPYMKGNVIVAK